MASAASTSTTPQTATTTTQNQESITLANVHHYLDGDGIFLPEEEEDHTGPTPHEIDAAIHNASSSLLIDPSSSDHTLHDAHLNSHGDEDGHDNSLIDPELMVDNDHDQLQHSQFIHTHETKRPANDNVSVHRQAKRRMLSDEAIRNPVAHLAPFVKPQRGDDTPHPEQLLFRSRGEFDEWLGGESSWCHYVQRRVTNPEKRAEERLKARLKAHERTLAAMTPEEAAAVPPLKRRRRNRTSAVVEKITYTCHHAGSYSSKHSEALPVTKLRMNTKTSVKCSCSSRIVLTEVEGGECQVMYYWKHEGHNPFASEELEAGRLPKVVDDWLTEQIEAGESVDSIRKKLDMKPEDKEEYIRKTTDDPSLIDPNLPPPLALSVKIKYPDIYNRFRKLRGPLKDNKPAKEFSGKPTRKSRTRQIIPASIEPTLGAVDMSPKRDHSPSQHIQGEASGSGSRERSLVDEHGHDGAMSEEGPTMLQSEDVDHQFDQHLAQLASDGQLAEALLQLPQGTNEVESSNGPAHEQSIDVVSGLEVGPPHDQDEEENLREAVLRMARAEREDWDSIVQQ